MKTFDPAFPINESTENGSGSYNLHVGLTIRDYFAAAALTGILAGRETVGCEPEDAARAYAYADAMMEERTQ